MHDALTAALEYANNERDGYSLRVYVSGHWVEGNLLNNDGVVVELVPIDSALEANHIYVNRKDILAVEVIF